jgi:hypothetical protein
MADEGHDEPAEPAGHQDNLVEGVEHLQAAAREVIRATRSLLDAAEGLVEDPTALQGVLGTLTTLAQAAVRSLGVDRSPGGSGDPDDDDGKVQRIQVT